MAKLSARGRTELLRIELERDVDNPDRSYTWERITRAIMSDGRVLEKRDLRWKPDTYHPNGEFYSYGWKVHGKAKAGKTAQNVVDSYMRIYVNPDLVAHPTWKPWTVVSGGPKPVMLSQSRVMRAIESGEYVGFCKACGHSQDGCEPDAQNYHCESCGAMEVYGAEECLMGL